LNNKNVHSTIAEMLEELEKNRNVSSERNVELGLKIYKLCFTTNYETGMAVSLLRIGQAYFNMSEYEKAIPYLFDSINLSQKLNLCDLQMHSYINIGNIYLDIGEYEKSLDYYNSAEKLAKLLKHSKNYYDNSSYEYYAAKIFNNIGEIYRLLGLYEEASKYYNMAYSFDRNLNFKASFGVIHINLGNIQYQLGNYDKALEYLKESIAYLIDYDYKIAIVEAYGILASVYEKKGDYKRCEKYFKKGIQISSEVAYDYNKIDLFMNFAKFLENIGKEELAINKLEEVYNISIESKLYSKKMEICKRIIELYEKNNDTNNANKYYKLYFENERILEPIQFQNKSKNFKMKVQLDSLEKENMKILENSENFRKKSEELIDVIKNISVISEVGGKLTTTLDLNQIYEMVNSAIQNYMQPRIFGVALYNNHNRTIEYKYCIENNIRIDVKTVSIDSEASIAAKCLRDKRIIIINDMHNEYLSYLDNVDYIKDNKASEGLNSAIFCPLIIDNNLIGVLTIQDSDKNFFTLLSIEIIKALTSYLAIAINNAIKSQKLHDEVKQRRNLQAKLESSNKKLKYMSENDELTKIANRRKFDSILKEEWDKAKLNQSFLSIIIFDIDFFKQYNDNYGHTAGDSCLKAISSELSKSLTNNYFAARYGGDEFVVLLPDTNLEKAIMYGEKLRQSVEALSLRHEFSKISDNVTITLGAYSLIPNDEITTMELIKQADVALYEAKKNGRNQIFVYNNGSS
jgi:diguanylate cyclase (GGDEF)-like protein